MHCKFIDVMRFPSTIFELLGLLPDAILSTPCMYQTHHCSMQKQEERNLYRMARWTEWL